MAQGDCYYLRFADTRALDMLRRVLAPEQMVQLKGPVEQWRYVDRFGDEAEFGAGQPVDSRRHGVIVLSDGQISRLLEQQLAGALAAKLGERGGGTNEPYLSREQYRHVETSAAFVLEHGIDPFEVQQRVSALAVETCGAVLTDARFKECVESLRASGQWSDLMEWRVA
jgi:hypothetical protein